MPLYIFIGCIIFLFFANKLKNKKENDSQAPENLKQGELNALGIQNLTYCYSLLETLLAKNNKITEELKGEHNNHITLLIDNKIEIQKSLNTVNELFEQIHTQNIYQKYEQNQKILSSFQNIYLKQIKKLQSQLYYIEMIIKSEDDKIPRQFFENY